MARLLVGFDGSPAARRALEYALHRAGPQDEVILLNVVPPATKTSSLSNMMPAGLELPTSMGGTFYDHTVARLEETVKEAAGRARATVSGLVRLGAPAQALLAAAAELKADEVVIGHRSYQPNESLGPNASAIVRDARVPVTVVP